METIANNLSDQTLTFMIWIVAVIIGALAYIPAYLSDRALNEYNKAFELANAKKKKEMGLFKNKPTPIIWVIIFWLVSILIFIGFVKYKKDSLSDNLKQRQQDDINRTISQMDSAVSRADNLSIRVSNVLRTLPVYGLTLDSIGNVVKVGSTKIQNTYNKSNGDIVVQAGYIGKSDISNNKIYHYSKPKKK